MITLDIPYTGHVEPGSNPQQRDVPGARIVKMAVGGMNNNVYLVQDTATGDALLIDAANESERILALLDQEVPEQLKLLVTTHQHFDHWQALSAVVADTGVPTAAHPLDAEPLPVRPDHLLAEGDSVSVGELAFEVVHLAGHTPGSVALVLEDGGGRTHVFTGDCLFPGGVGKTGSPEDFDSLYRDVTTKLFDRFGDETVIYPGHGDDTTLGAERPQLQQWRQRGW